MARSRQGAIPARTFRGATDRSRIRSIAIGGDGADSISGEPIPPWQIDGPAAVEAIPGRTRVAPSRGPCPLSANSTEGASLREHGDQRRSPASRSRLLTGQIRCPILHEPTPPLEQVRAPVGGLDLVANDVCKRRLRHLAGVVGLLGGPSPGTTTGSRAAPP